MQAIKDVAIRTAKLADEDRDELEALRGEESDILWRKAVKVYEIHEQYKSTPDIAWPRSEVADACGVQPRSADEMVNTVERVGSFYECVGYEDICYNAWKYIARHEDPQSFLDALLDDMVNWGGKFPPVSVIRMKLAAAKGNAPPPRPESFAAKVRGIDRLNSSFEVVVGDDELLEKLQRGMGITVTLVKQRTGTVADSAGGAKAGA